MLLRSRSNRLIRGYWADGFMPFEPVGAWEFLATNGRRLLEKSLPVWEVADRAAPVVTGVDPDARLLDTPSWPLPLLAIGLVWLLWRGSTRRFGLVIAGFYCTCLIASVLRVYPFGVGRPDIFAFPAAICLFAAGIQAVTELAGRARTVARLAAAGTAVAFALACPVQVEYHTREQDAQIARAMSELAQPQDAIILSQGAGFLAAFYGRWPVALTPTDQLTYGVQATIVRDRTLQLPWGPMQGRLVEQPTEQLIARLLEEVRPTRVWYLSFPASRRGAVGVVTLQHHGYAVREVQTTSRSALYLAVDDTGRRGSAVSGQERDG